MQNLQLILYLKGFVFQSNIMKKFCYILGVFLSLLMFSSYSFANIKDVMKFKENNIENAWSVDLFKSQGKHVVVSSVNGKVTHGDRLSKFFSDTDCNFGTLQTTFLTELKHPEIYKLEKKLITVNFGGSDIKVYISGVMDFLDDLGHMLIIDMNLMKIENIKKFFRRNNQQQVSLIIQNDESTSVLKYLYRDKRKHLETSRNQLSQTNSDETPLNFYDFNKQDKRTKRHLL